MMNISTEIKSFARSLGFNLVNIIPARPLPEEEEHVKKWLKKGFEADLEYMKKSPEKRTDPEKILPGAKSIICLAINYYQEKPAEIPENSGIVARYAWGKDYHKVIDKKLKKLRRFIIENCENPLNKSDFKLYTDAGPFLERAYAAEAGLGFIGKNTTLITPEYGSWVFLAEIITTLKLQHDKPVEKFLGSCGSCTKCIDACPTGAIVNPYEIDARKCISYQTIENKEEIPQEIHKKMKNRIFGCDICQEVCPHNCRAKKTDVQEFRDFKAGPFINPEKMIHMKEEEFNKKYENSPVKRAGLKGIIRNIQNML